MEDKEMQGLIEAAVDKAITTAGLKEINRKFVPGGEETEPGEKSEGQFENIGQFLRAVHKAAVRRDVDPRLVSVKATGLSEEVPSEGGFLVQQEFIAKIVEKTYEMGILAGKCYRQPVGPGFKGVTIPAIDETSRADGSRWGGIRVYRGAEGGTKTASKPSIRKIAVDAEKLYGLCVMTDELLEDAVALAGYLNRWFPLEFGFKLDDEIVNGTGVGMSLGILNSPALVTVAKETGQAAKTVIAENVLNMWARMWAPSYAKGFWYVNQDVLPQLPKMSIAVGTGGIPVYMPPGGLSGQPYATLLGRPVVPIEQCATLGSVGDIILADLSEYILVEKGNIKAETSIHVYFSTDETAFRWVWRIKGQPLWNAALTPFKGTNTLSPFVALAVRA